MVALIVLYVPSFALLSDGASHGNIHKELTVSISITARKAFSDMPDMGAKKFPAAPFT
jgi:hypothetical protein